MPPYIAYTSMPIQEEKIIIIIGDNLFMSTGAKITSAIELGNNVTIAPNAVVTKSFKDNLFLTGLPADIKSERKPWFENNEPFSSRHMKCEELKNSFFS